MVNNKGKTGRFVNSKFFVEEYSKISFLNKKNFRPMPRKKTNRRWVKLKIEKNRKWNYKVEDYITGKFYACY